MESLSLGIVSDEISSDFAEAVRHGTSWGIRIYELRVLKTGRVPHIEESELNKVLDLVQQYRIRISALSPGIFKHQLSKHNELEAELTQTLPQTFTMAKFLGASMVIVFGFQREQGEPDSNFNKAVRLLRRAAQQAEQEGFTLLVENEPGFWCDSGVNTAKLIQAVGSKAFRANWDPCNGFGTSEQPYPDGYEALKPYIGNVHVKDTLKGSLIQCVPVGEGAIDWKGQIQALIRDRVVQHVTLETHCLPLIENSKRNVNTLQRYMNEQ
ncbi:MAG: sugar phosphate isomerase/epimerase family protein [bacterium]